MFILYHIIPGPSKVCALELNNMQIGSEYLILWPHRWCMHSARTIFKRLYFGLWESRLQIYFFCWYNSDIALSLPWYAQKFGSRSFYFSTISILFWDTLWMSILFWNTLWLSLLFWNSLWLSILCFGEGNLKSDELSGH